MVVRQAQVSAPLAAAPSGIRQLGPRGVGRAAFRDEFGGVRIRRRPAGQHLRDAAGRAQSLLSLRVTLGRFRSCR